MSNCLIIYLNSGLGERERLFCLRIAEQTGRHTHALTKIPENLSEFCDENNIDIVFYACDNRRRQIQCVLDASRELRIPYVVITDSMDRLAIPIQHVLAPVSFLEEDIHKTETCLHFGRIIGAEIVLLQAKDYGHKALHHTERIATALEKAELRYRIEAATKDSFGVNMEAAKKSAETDLLIVTASREYGLDDILIGPQERHVIQKSRVPVLLLNPRGDLYSLCD